MKTLPEAIDEVVKDEGPPNPAMDVAWGRLRLLLIHVTDLAAGAFDIEVGAATT